MASLKRFPFDTLKIDRSFVRGLSSSGHADLRFVSAIVGLAESLGMVAVAEGAETTGEVDVIRSLGCTFAQGYIFGKPMSSDEATARVADGFDPTASADTHHEREPRVALFLRGQLHSDRRTHPVRVRNISGGGALIEIDPSARICNSVELQLSSTETYRAHVRWSNDRRVGIAFEDPIDIVRVVKGAENGED